MHSLVRDKDFPLNSHEENQGQLGVHMGNAMMAWPALRRLQTARSDVCNGHLPWKLRVLSPG